MQRWGRVVEGILANCGERKFNYIKYIYVIKHITNYTYPPPRYTRLGMSESPTVYETMRDNSWNRRLRCYPQMRVLMVH